MRYLNWLVLLTLIMFVFSNGVFAQKPVDNKNLEIIPDETYDFYRFDNMRVNKITGIPVALYNVNYEVIASTPEDMARQYLYDNAELLFQKSDIDGLVHSSTRETPGGYHVRFNQYVGKIPVYNSDIVVNINRDNTVTFVMNDYKPISNTVNKSSAVTSLQAKKTATNHIGIQGKISFEKNETVIYNNKGKSTLVHKVNLVPSEDHFGDWEVLVDASSGEIIRVEDKALYSDKKDTGSGWVFDPDPLTRARATYGDPGFSDNNDADSDSLTANILQVDLLEITLTGSTYSLSGPYAEIVDTEAPFDGVFSQDSSIFHYTRGQDAFEAVNVYHHIDQSMRYINETLGFNLMPFQYTGGVRSDPHGLSGADNSHYIPSTGVVAWGEGDVDDSEDEDVILHELGHGIHDWITNGGGSQVDGLSEGCGDYWAVSYNRSTGFWTPSDPQYNWVFQWDGHNVTPPSFGWPGRITNYPNLYPGGLVGQIHTDGQIWASTLMQIYDDIGRTATDSDFLEALSMTNGSSGQEDAAQAFIQADVNLFGGANLSSIEFWFTQRGYNVTVPTPQITHTPLGDTEDLTGPYPVTATITAAGPLAEALLIYGTNGVFTDSIDMILVSGNEYSASIPGTGVSTDFNYYIFAADSGGLASTNPAGAPGNYHQFYAGADTLAPVITHTPLRDQAYIRWPATVTAYVTDNLGVADVIVNYYVNNTGNTGSFQMTDQGAGNYLGTFNIDTSSVSVGDSIFYRITATDNSTSSNITNDPTAGFYQFYIIDAKGVVLVIDDDVTKTNKVEGEKGTYYRDKGTLGVSSNNMERWLTNIGYVVEHVNVATSLTMNWDEYSIVINSSGGNADPVADASYRTMWESYASDPSHKYIIEGGEVGYDVASSPSYPAWETIVIHSDTWAGDVSGDMPLRQDYLNHPIANFPNQIPQILTLNNPGFGDQDSQNNLPGAYVVYGNTHEPDNAGILIYDDTPNPTSAQMAFYAFNFGIITDSTVAMNLLENTLEFLLTPESAAIGSITGNVDLTDTANDSGVVVYLNGINNDTTTTDNNGDYSFTGLYNGMYMVTTGHPGYFPYFFTIDSIQVADNTLAGNDFSFDPIVLGTVTGIVALSDTGDNIYAYVEVIGQNSGSDTTDPTGIYQVENIMPGSIRVIASKTGYRSVQIDTFLNNDGSMLNIDFTLYPGVNDYVFDFEDDNGGFVGSGSWEWGTPTSGPGSAYSGSNAWATGLSGNYTSSEHAELITPELDLSGFNEPKLKFMHWYDMEDNSITPGSAYDGGNVKISTDGGSNFSIINPIGGYPFAINAASNALNGQAAFSGTSVGWEVAEFDLSAYQAMNVLLKFDFGSDISVQFAGWYVDSVAVYTMDTVITKIGLDDGFNGIPKVFALQQNYPNPFNPVTTIRYQLPKTANVKLAIYTMLGQRVKTLVNENQAANYYTIQWDGLNESGNRVASGIYLYRIEAGDPSADSGHRFIKTNKMLLLK